MGEKNRTKKMTVRFTTSEFEKLEASAKKTIGANLSDYARRLLLGQPIQVKFRNESMDLVMEELISIRQELNAIGKNYNQAVKRLHSLRQIPEFREWLRANESTHEVFAMKMDEIQNSIANLSGRWLGVP